MDASYGGLVVVLGVGIVGGVAGAALLKRMGVPQVLAYLAVGLLLGQTGLHLIEPDDLVRLSLVNHFFLSVIGFLVGCEIRLDSVRKHGKQFSAILLAEGMLACVLTAGATFAVLVAVTGNPLASLAAALVLGAIASATDPASTMSVLWEYRSAGILTTTITAIVALDDALAMTLYGLASSAARLMTGSPGGVGSELLASGGALLAAVGIGCAAGAIGILSLVRSDDPQRPVIATIGSLLLTTGICAWLDVDVIMAAMAAGVVVTNWHPVRSERLVAGVKGFSGPVYILFFVFVGARLRIAALPLWLWWVVGAYVVSASAGKIIGSWAGARLSGADRSVSRYTGMSILSQGGIAVSLAVISSHRLGSVPLVEGFSLGDTILFSVTAAISILQLGAPPLTALCVKRAGETNRRVTDEDLMRTMSAGSVADASAPTAQPTTPLSSLFRTFATTRYHSIALVDDKGVTREAVALDILRDSILDPHTWDWVIAADVAHSPRLTAAPHDNVLAVLRAMEQAQEQEVVVVDADNRYHGMLGRGDIREAVKKALIARGV